MSDPAKYRTKEEVSTFKDGQDPIATLKAMMAKEGIGEDELKDIDKEIKAVVNESADFAQESPEPHEDELWTDILVEVNE